MPQGFRVEGAEQLKVLAAELKVADKVMLRQMRRDLRAAVQPVLEAVKVKAQTFSKTIPPSLAIQTRFTGRKVGVWIAALSRKLPEGHKGLARLQEFGSSRNYNVIRHPSRQGPNFSQPGPWVTQPSHPFLIKTANDHAVEVEEAMRRVMDATARAAGFK